MKYSVKLSRHWQCPTCSTWLNSATGSEKGNTEADCGRIQGVDQTSASSSGGGGGRGSGAGGGSWPRPQPGGQTPIGSAQCEAPPAAGLHGDHLRALKDKEWSRERNGDRKRGADGADEDVPGRWTV